MTVEPGQPGIDLTEPQRKRAAVMVASLLESLKGTDGAKRLALDHLGRCDEDRVGLWQDIIGLLGRDEIPSKSETIL